MLFSRTHRIFVKNSKHFAIKEVSKHKFILKVGIMEATFFITMKFKMELKGSLENVNTFQFFSQL